MVARRMALGRDSSKCSGGFSVFDEIAQANLDKTPEEVERDVAREIAALRREKAFQRKRKEAGSCLERVQRLRLWYGWWHGLPNRRPV